MMTLDNISHFLHHWDAQTFETGDINRHLNENLPAMEPPLSDYVEDEIISWGDKCKRRIVTTPSYFHDSFETCGDLHDVFQNFWDSSDLDFGEVSNNVSGIIQESTSLLLDCPNFQPMDELHVESLHSSDSTETVPLPLDPTKQDHLSRPPLPAIFSSPIKNCTFLDNNNMRSKKRSRESAIAVLSPFVVVKPRGTSTGTDGCITIDDINKKLKMTPARPIRHPVGEFACGPRVSAGGPGLSGKAVVSLTRIYTSGRGTITIIRTRG